jgi:hypothetical protein
MLVSYGQLARRLTSIGSGPLFDCCKSGALQPRFHSEPFTVEAGSMVSKHRNNLLPNSNAPAVAPPQEIVACGYCGSPKVLRMVAGLQLLKIGEQLVSAADSRRALLPVVLEMCEDCRKIQLKESS